MLVLPYASGALKKRRFRIAARRFSSSGMTFGVEMSLHAVL